MSMLRAYKYKLIPTEEQADKIRRFCGCSRLVYNAMLSDIKNKLENKETPSPLKVTQLYPDHEFLKEVDSLALANARINLSRAINDFWKSRKGKRKGKRLGFPNFKKKNISRDSYTTNNQSGTIKIVDSHIKLPKMGYIKIKYHKPIDGVIRSATVSINKDGSMEVSVLCLTESKQIKKKITNIKEIKVIGLDMSMSDFYVSSDGEKPNFQREYRKSEGKRRRLNKSLHRKKLVKTGEFAFSKKWNKDVEIKKPSKNREKARLKLAKLERHVLNKRKDYCHKLSRKLVNQNDVIVLEDVNMQTMSRCLKLGKSVNDLGFGMFRTFMEYKSIDTDTLVVRVPKFFPSSKLCNTCGCVNKNLALKDRVWICPDCGTEHDRDMNASYNLRDYFINEINTVGTTEFQACGEGTSGLRETLIKVLSVKQEGNLVRFANDINT